MAIRYPSFAYDRQKLCTCNENVVNYNSKTLSRIIFLKRKQRSGKEISERSMAVRNEHLEPKELV